jgi:hypothetical protein
LNIGETNCETIALGESNEGKGEIIMRIQTRVLVLSLSVALGAAGTVAAKSPSSTRTIGSADGIEVFGTSWGSLAYCAAATFARQRLNASATDRILLSRPYGPSPTQPNQLSVGFELVPQDVRGRRTIFMRTGKRGVGESYSVAHAVAQCPKD